MSALDMLRQAAGFLALGLNLSIYYQFCRIFAQDLHFFTCLTLPILVGIFSSPFFGMLADKCGPKFVVGFGTGLLLLGQLVLSGQQRNGRMGPKVITRNVGTQKFWFL